MKTKTNKFGIEKLIITSRKKITLGQNKKHTKSRFNIQKYKRPRKILS